MPPLKLPDFASDGPAQETAAPLATEEAGTLAAFEDGYKAGWEDAATAQADAKATREAEVARHVQAIAFAQDEARVHVLRSLEPLLTRIVGTVLPEMARATLAPVVAEAILPLAERAAAAPILLRCGPEARPLVEDHLSRIPGLSFEIREDATLPDGCVQIAQGPVELLVDLESVTAAVLQTVEAFFQTETKERQDAG